MAASHRYILLAAAVLISIVLFTTNPPYVQKAASSASSLLHSHKASPPAEETASAGRPQAPASQEEKASSSILELEHQISSTSVAQASPPTSTLVEPILAPSTKATETPIVYATNSPATPSTGPDSSQAVKSKYAYVSFLQQNALHEDTDNDEDDEYFVSVRILGYKVMHSPQAATNASIPFVVVVTKLVSERKRKRLEKDGATVIEVDDVPNPDWLDTEGVTSRWAGLMTKLRVFQLVQFEKILFLDTDIFVLQQMDDIFEDPGTKSLEPLDDRERKSDEAPLPSTYMLAGQAQAYGWDHPYPPAADNEYMCGGFFVTAPSQSIFDYYLSVLHAPNRFDTQFMEQNLLNYAHRRDGPMPWTDVYYKWTSTYPVYDDYKDGARSLHHKFWQEDTNTPDFGLNKLTAMWFQAKGEMTGYYRARDDGAAHRSP